MRLPTDLLRRLATTAGRAVLREALDRAGGATGGRRRPDGGGRPPGIPRSPSAPGRRAPRDVVATDRVRPLVDYAPAADGDADPGEVVWTWVPYEDDPAQGKDRPVLVIGRVDDDVAALALTSRRRDDRHHHPLGAWDPRDGRESWVRLDRVLRLDPEGIRREGAVLPRDRFDRAVAAWRGYGG